LLKLRWSPLSARPGGWSAGQAAVSSMRVCWWSGLASGAACKTAKSCPIRWTCWFGCKRPGARFGRSGCPLGAPQPDSRTCSGVGCHGHKPSDQGSPLQLELPHPRLRSAPFVLAPLAAIEPGLVPPGEPQRPPLCCSSCGGPRRHHRSFLPGRTAGAEWGAIASGG